MKEHNEKKLDDLIFNQRESNWSHYSYDLELSFYSKVCAGDVEAVEKDILVSNMKIHGSLSKNPLNNARYLFVASATLLTRHCINAGMDAMEAFACSDFFINQMDNCNTLEEIADIDIEMRLHYTRHMAQLNRSDKNPVYSKPIYSCMDYIYNHLHEKISLNDLADYVSLSPNYLETLFKKETGITIQNYAINRKIDAAKRMLTYTEYSLTDIGNYLAFSSTSHFIKVFKERTGVTPKNFKKNLKLNFSVPN